MADNHLLKKPSASIYIENDKISQLGRKAFNFLLKKAQPEMLNQSIHTVDLKEFRSVVNTKSNSKYLQEIFKALAGTPVIWNYTRRDNKNVWGTAALISDAEIIDNKIIEYSFSEKMRRMLHRPNIYALIDLRVQGRITSKYTLALYEMAVDICRMADRCGESIWHTLEEAYVILGVPKTSKYRKRFNNFKSQVLDKSIAEVNEKTEYTVEYRTEAREGGKRITHIKFIITCEGECIFEKNIKNKSSFKNIELPSELFELIPHDQRSGMMQIAKEILRDYGQKGPTVLKFYINYAKDYWQNGPAKNWGAVIRMAIGRHEYEMAQEKLIRQKELEKKQREQSDNSVIMAKKREEQYKRRLHLVAGLSKKENEAFEIYILRNDGLFRNNPNRKIVDGTKIRNIEPFLEYLKENPIHTENVEPEPNLFVKQAEISHDEKLKSLIPENMNEKQKEIYQQLLDPDNIEIINKITEEFAKIKGEK